MPQKKMFNSHQVKIIRLFALIGALQLTQVILTGFRLYFVTPPPYFLRIYVWWSNRIDHSLNFHSTDTKMEPQLQHVCRIIILFIITANTLLGTSQPGKYRLSPEDDNATIYEMTAGGWRRWGKRVPADSWVVGAGGDDGRKAWEADQPRGLIIMSEIVAHINKWHDD